MDPTATRTATTTTTTATTTTTTRTKSRRRKDRRRGTYFFFFLLYALHSHTHTHLFNFLLDSSALDTSSENSRKSRAARVLWSLFCMVGETRAIMTRLGWIRCAKDFYCYNVVVIFWIEARHWLVNTWRTMLSLDAFLSSRIQEIPYLILMRPTLCSLPPKDLSRSIDMTDLVRSYC